MLQRKFINASLIGRIPHGVINWQIWNKRLGVRCDRENSERGSVFFSVPDITAHVYELEETISQHIAKMKNRGLKSIVYIYMSSNFLF